MSKTPTTAANLYAGAKSYALAMRKLFASDIMSSALVTPYYFLAGFSLELSLKSIILAAGGQEKDIITLGHDLVAGYELALQKGYKPKDTLWMRRMVEAMNPPHKGFELRYVPDKTEIQLPKPDILLKVLAEHLDEVEDQFPVWGNDPSPDETA